MLFLISPLLFIGFFSPVNSVSVDSENKKSNENLISLRDYDFVGEDQRLSALLAERMAVLRAPLNLSQPAAGGGPAPWPRGPGSFQREPDYLHSNVRLPQLVNVSMDYAELINASLLRLAPRPGRSLAPGPGGTPAPSHSVQLGRVDGRRWADPSFLDNNKKILELMKQSIYTTQRKITELDPLVSQFERDPRFRMAFIFSRLDEWLHDMRTVLFSTMKQRPYPRRVKRVIWYYENMLRLNIDITYSVEHLVYLHSEYMKNIEQIMPLKLRKQLRAMKKEQEKLKKMKKYGITSRPDFGDWQNFPGRPPKL